MRYHVSLNFSFFLIFFMFLHFSHSFFSCRCLLLACFYDVNVVKYGSVLNLIGLIKYLLAHKCVIIVLIC